MTRKSSKSINRQQKKDLNGGGPRAIPSSTSSFLFTNPAQTPRPPPPLEQTAIDQTPPPPPMIKEEDLPSDYYTDLTDHLLQSYTEANYSDFVLHVNFGGESNTSSFALHSLIVSQSPFLKSLNDNDKNGGEGFLFFSFRLNNAFLESNNASSSNNNNNNNPIIITIQFSFAIYETQNDSTSSRMSISMMINSSSVSLVLASLYSPNVLSHHLNKENCKQVLTTCKWFKLKKLTKFVKNKICIKILLEGIETMKEFKDWIEYISMLEKLEEDLLQSPEEEEEEEEEESLKEILLKRLKNLSIEFKAFNFDNVPTAQEEVSRGQEDLVQVFKSLPFEWFKNVLESQDFKVPSEMDRFNFAKKCVKIRKQYFYSQQQQSPPPQPQQTCDSSSSSSPSFSTISSSSPATTSFSSTSIIDNQFPEVVRGQNGLDKPPSSSFSSFEETVVLGFDNSGSGSGGGQNQSLVKILRKPIRRKVSLWKIGPMSS